MQSEKRVRRLLLCATGAFESYALPGFILALLQHCADDVQVVMSRAAAELSSPTAVEVASRHSVFTDLGDRRSGVFVPHIELARAADLILVYPATANILGKIANGITDELVSALIIAASAPVIIVPVMNPVMWEHPAVRRNVATLEGDGYSVLPNVAAVEIATREGLDEMAAPFPFPTLLMRIQSIAASRKRKD